MSGSLRRLAIWALILLIWEGAYRVVGWDALLFPSPSQVFQSVVDMFRVSPAFDERPLAAAPLVSLLRLAMGFALSLMLGGLIGLLMWRFAEIDKLFGPLCLGVQTLPSVCWVPLAILAIRSGEEHEILFVVVMGSFCAVAIALRDGLRVIPPVYQQAGLMLGARGWRLYRYVLLPASLPALATSLRQGFSFAWRSLMGAELIFAVEKHGLGFYLSNARNNIDVAQVVAIMLTMVVMGMLADRLVFAPIQKTVQARFGLA